MASEEEEEEEEVYKLRPADKTDHTCANHGNDVTCDSRDAGRGR